ncbi:MAG: Crp/Fnr family transcriptional regulator [Dehalogenimonas sp.]|uniref:Crp/Fnr family transcriptional regulator n=1 Tax=Candidatus Dehalogenimonas loeffleri TaxID=3127115 RepID=A0ABZ2J2I5_9CHLR|nr:Crp/Fnr family transcriptional regulator [Dehalogenimonas sp.]
MSNTTIPKNKIALPVIGRRELLMKSPYFAGLSEENLLRVEEMMREEHFDRDHFIFTEGDDNHYLYLTASGAVKVFGTSADGKEQILSLARPGDSFNDVAAFDGRLSPAGAQALTPVILYRLSGPELLSRSCSYGALAANIIRALGQRIRELGDLVSDLSFRPVAGRLAKLLLEQLPHSGSVKLTQRDMASMAGTAREVVARALKSMEDDGILRIERQHIIILKRDVLEKMAA